MSLLHTNNRNQIPRGGLSVSSSSPSCFGVSLDRCSLIADGCSHVHPALTQMRDRIHFSSCTQAPAVHSLESHLNMLKAGGCFRAVESYVLVTNSLTTLKVGYTHSTSFRHSSAGLSFFCLSLSLIPFLLFSDLGIPFVSLSSVITRVFTGDNRTHSATLRKKGCNSRVYGSSQDCVRVPGRQAH